LESAQESVHAKIAAASEVVGRRQAWDDLAIQSLGPQDDSIVDDREEEIRQWDLTLAWRAGAAQVWDLVIAQPRSE
jgi:hypothetical protein